MCTVNFCPSHGGGGSEAGVTFIIFFRDFPQCDKPRIIAVLWLVNTRDPDKSCDLLYSEYESSASSVKSRE